MDTKADVIERQRRVSRRRFPLESKRRIVEETVLGGESVSVVARRHDINANQLFRWRKQYREGRLGGEGAARLVPICVSEAATPVVAPPPAQAGTAEAGSLEIVLRNGHRLHVRGAVDASALRLALEVLGR